jgi:hypothetical protein
MPSGSKKLSSDELRERGAKPHRWRKRLAEEQAKIAADLAAAAPPAEPLPPAPPDPLAVDAYTASVLREWSTFAARHVSGEIIAREYGSGPFPGRDQDYADHGAIYNWHPGLLRTCRDYAEQIASNPEKTGTWSMELATRFLADLSKSDFVFDVEGSKNVEKMIQVFADSTKHIPMLRILAMVEFLCWKKSDGSDRFPDEGLLDFHEDDIATMDAASNAQRLALAAA